MSHSIIRLDELLDLYAWQGLQDSIAKAVGLSIGLIDYRNVPLSSQSNFSIFCQEVQANPAFVEHCQRCYSRGVLEALRMDAPYYFRCNFDIVKVIIPIVIEGRYIGAVVTGQVKISGDGRQDSIEKYTNIVADSIDEPKIAISYSNIPSISFEELKNCVAMISTMLEYIIESELKHMGSYSSNSAAVADQNLSENSLGYLQLSDLEKLGINAILFPALQYIHHHIGSKITLTDMADLVHLSPSYFSRLFSGEMGISFSDYVAKTKIEYAKNMLLEYNQTITSVAQKLGFHDVSYFIKVFRKFENTTPHEYKNKQIYRHRA